MPDISLFAATGSISDSFYIICEADQDPNGVPCSLNASSFDFIGVGGTSAAATTFAGMMALVNQNIAVNHNSLPAAQGNANYVLYPMYALQLTAASQGGYSCNSSTTPNSACVFNDITKGNNSVPCISLTFTLTSCSNQFGVLETFNLSDEFKSGEYVATSLPAFAAATGPDLATGLGSVNAYNLVNNWASAVGAFTPTSTTLCIALTAPTSFSCPNTSGTPVVLTHGTPVFVNIAVNGQVSGTPIPVSQNLTTALPSTTETVALVGTSVANPSCNIPGCARAAWTISPRTRRIQRRSIRTV